jgi:hypothetical protein
VEGTGVWALFGGLSNLLLRFVGYRDFNAKLFAELLRWFD